ncbi:hypothetical protein Anapl_15262 [Anas platyrhynchos]|uniref:Uncharacterized protein n=1 Tax=Anas platyrhynchos TaxID=8839 RepID=R0KXA8_ANAPL|nr:hypothetical protein Anapl_15262 [Anas platyrhynchos]
MAHALILSPDTPGKIDESSQHAIPDECHLWLSNQLASMSKDLECPVGRWKGFVRVLSDESLKNASPAIPFGLRAACADAKPARDSHWLLTSFGSAIPSGKLEWLREAGQRLKEVREKCGFQGQRQDWSIKHPLVLHQLGSPCEELRQQEGPDGAEWDADLLLLCTEPQKQEEHKGEHLAVSK